MINRQQPGMTICFYDLQRNVNFEWLSYDVYRLFSNSEVSLINNFCLVEK